MRRLIIALLLGLALIGASPDPAYGLDRAQVTATRISGEIRVDGLLAEPEWASARPIGDFRLILQREDEAPSESTEVRVLFDPTHVYFGITCHNRGAGAVRASLTPRDQITDGDHIAVHLDTYRDTRRAYIFGINPYGVQLDGILDGDAPDFSWDAVWEGESRRRPDGWTAEISIPLHAMRFPRHGDGVWGLWFRRAITKNDEVCSWPLWRQALQGDIMLQAADLTGLEGMRRGGGLDAEPYVSSLTQQQFLYTMSPAIPPAIPVLQRYDFSDRTYNAGVDLRFPITTTLIANGTVNPDYSQVEADAIQIDLNQRFPLFYAEKRPFFLEGADLFNTPINLVYTRRIADPLVGAKLTGKQGRWNLGVISARDQGGGSLAGTGAGSQEGGSRDGYFHIGRLSFDAGQSSRAGFLVAAHQSDNHQGGFLPADIPANPLAQGGHNVVLAGDTRWKLARSLFFTGQLAWSTTRVDSSSDRRGSNIVAHDRFSDVGYHGTLRYADGTRDVSVYQEYLGPEFRNESGFLQRVDVRQTGFNSNFYVRPENRWLRSAQPILDGYAIHDHTGGLQEWWVSPMVDWLFQKQTHAHTMYVRSQERWQGRDFDRNTYIFVLDNTLLRPLEVSFDMTVGDGIFYADTREESYRGWSEFYEWGATLRPDPRLTTELTATKSRFSREFMGEEIFDVWALGAKTTFQFTKRFYARVYPQYDTGERHFDADALLGYVLHPGSVVYVGWNGDYDRVHGRQRSTQRTLFFKASHRFGV